MPPRVHHLLPTVVCVPFPDFRVLLVVAADVHQPHHHLLQHYLSPLEDGAATASPVIRDICMENESIVTSGKRKIEVTERDKSILKHVLISVSTCLSNVKV